MNARSCKCAAAACAGIGLSLFAASVYFNVDLKFAASLCMVGVLALALGARRQSVSTTTDVTA
jgi:hypothetical protein